MDLSVSREPFYRKSQTRFRTVTVQDKRHFKDIILNTSWSPIVFAGGGRRSSNFLSARVCAVDVDHGLSISSAKSMLRGAGLKSIIATTKSHREGADRFRVIAFFETLITDLKTYEYNITKVISAFGGDACGDGGRYFFPSREIVFDQDGRGVTVGREPVETDAPAAYEPPKHLARDKLPLRVKMFLKGHLQPDWSRHATIYYAARVLASCGVPFETVTRTILELDFDRRRVGGYITDSEIERTIADAFDKEAKRNG